MKQLLLGLLGACVLHLTVSAHVLDQYLQVAQIALAPDGVRVELRLIPGVQVAERICTLIDTDGNGHITTEEEQAYARRVSQDIGLALNGVQAPFRLKESQFPTLQEIREGVGTIRLSYEAAIKFEAADHQQLLLRNNHLPELGVYLVNTLVPATSEIKIRGQERDVLQRELRLSFDVTSTGSVEQQRWGRILMFCLCLMLLIPQWKHLRNFLRRFNDERIQTKKTFS